MQKGHHSIMKTILALLLAAVLICTTAGLGYLAYKRQQTPDPKPSSSSKSQKDTRPWANPQNQLQEELLESKTDPELLEKLMYEMSKNSDTVGWLQVPGTTIDNSVVQYHNNSYYLRRDERRRDALYGCYYADYECSIAGRDELMPNTVIYGHSDLQDNPKGQRFSQLFKFVQREFATTNNIISLSTPDETLEWEVFAVFYTDTKFDYIRVDNTPEVQQSIIDTALRLSIHDFGVAPSGEDKILTLSTCSVRDGNDGNHRFVVMSRLI